MSSVQSRYARRFLICLGYAVGYSLAQLGLGRACGELFMFYKRRSREVSFFYDLRVPFLCHGLSVTPRACVPYSLVSRRGLSHLRVNVPICPKRHPVHTSSCHLHLCFASRRWGSISIITCCNMYCKAQYIWFISTRTENRVPVYIAQE